MHVAYLCMARTTLVLDDNLLRQIKKKAAAEGRTLHVIMGPDGKPRSLPDRYLELLKSE